jgi:hypothetical protein
MAILISFLCREQVQFLTDHMESNILQLNHTFLKQLVSGVFLTLDTFGDVSSSLLLQTHLSPKLLRSRVFN